MDWLQSGCQSAGDTVREADSQHRRKWNLHPSETHESWNESRDDLITRPLGPPRERDHKACKWDGVSSCPSLIVAAWFTTDYLAAICASLCVETRGGERIIDAKQRGSEKWLIFPG